MLPPKGPPMPKAPAKPPASKKFNPAAAAAKVAVLRGKKPPKGGAPGGLPPGETPPEQGY